MQPACVDELPKDFESFRLEPQSMPKIKKGDPNLAENYRPISKVLAAIILQRLKDGGSEERLSEAQFGFRPRHDTGQALLLARRMIDELNRQGRIANDATP